MTTIVEQIVNREIDSVIVYESDQVIAFADHDPINFGHILICPKTQYRTFIDLPESVLLEITDVARDLYKRIEAKFNPDGIGFMQNNGDAPHFNELDHYHLHIFPRFHGNQYGWVSSELGFQTIDKLRESLKDL
ncbi:HIT family protein [Vibrio parahaemolyticus]|uniref:HIT family protein n=1 Tax=Vibrio parahaemolyticus TaxID=670 RepID=UPI001482A35E|nr:HIT family protein [Vibrio parahaemolyticus]ELA9369568.1 HIT family protein [Vibrio parahaemolyticus]HCG8705101.1 HIT family protein [Vibrio parahaemolyticus]